MFINLEYEQLTNEKGDAILQALTEKGEQDFIYLGSWTNTVTSAQKRLCPGDL